MPRSDAVACEFSLMFFPDKLAGLYGGVGAVPGGAFVFNVDPCWRTTTWRASSMRPCCACSANAGRRSDTPYGYYRIDEIKTLLGQAGLGRIEISVLPKISR